MNDQAHPARPYDCVTTFVGSMGAHDASQVTALPLEKYAPRTLVLIGIAGSLDRDVLVGDVVVANQVDDYLQDAKISSGFEAAGRSYQSHARLINVVSNFRYASNDVVRRLADASRAELLAALAGINVSDVEGLVRTTGFDYAIGHLASGPVVGASTAFAAWLKHIDRKHLALEMESAGVMNAFYQRAGDERVLIVRGISDLSDSRKPVLDDVKHGAFRRLAMHNAIGLVFSLLEQGRLEHASATEGNQGGPDIDDKIVDVERPILRVGFNNADPYDLSILREVTISPTWPGDRNHSNAVTLTVSTLNLGTRTVRDLLWIFVFDGFPEQGQVLSPYGEPMYPVIQPASAGDAEPLKVVPDPKGCAWCRGSRTSILEPSKSTLSPYSCRRNNSPSP